MKNQRLKNVRFDFLSKNWNKQIQEMLPRQTDLRLEKEKKKKKRTIPLHAELNELVNGGIQRQAILFVSQQLDLLNHMNPPPAFQIRRVHVLYRLLYALLLLRLRRSEILHEPPHRPPPQLPRVLPTRLLILLHHLPLREAHRLLRRREQAVPVGRNLSSVRQPEDHRSGGAVLRVLPQHALRVQPLQVAALLVLKAVDRIPLVHEIYGLDCIKSSSSSSSRWWWWW